MTATSSTPDLATRRALAILRELNIDPADAETLRRVRGFIRVNGYPGALHAALITKNVSLRLNKAGRQPIKDRWAYCRQVYNQAAGYASWVFTLLNLAKVSLRAWVDGVLAERAGPGWHTRLSRFFRPTTIARVEAELASRGVTNLATLATGAEMLDLIDFGTLRSLIRDGYGAAPSRAGLLLPSLPSDGVSGPHLESKRLDAMLKSLNDARNDVMHHRLMTTPTFTKLLTELRSLLERRDFDVDRTVERVETGRLQALDLGPTWLIEPVWHATTGHAQARRTTQLVRQVRTSLPAVAGDLIQVRGLASTPAPHMHIVVAVASRDAKDTGDPLELCPKVDSEEMRRLLAATGAIDVRFVRWTGKNVAALINAVCTPLQATSVKTNEDGSVALVYAIVDRDAALAHVGIELVAQLLRAPIRLTFA